MATNERYSLDPSKLQRLVLPRSVADRTYLDNERVKQRKLTGAGYAWGRSIHELAKPYLARAERDTKGPFTVLDTCSSFPFLAAILVEDRIDRCDTEAISIIRKSGKSGEVPAFENLDPAIQQHLTSPNARIGTMLTAHVHRMLFEPPFGDNDSDPEKQQKMKGALDHGFREFAMFDRLHGSLATQTSVHDFYSQMPPELFEQSRFLFKTVQENLQDLVGSVKAVELMDGMSNYYSQQSLARARRFIVMSLDTESIEALTQAAKLVFPDEIQERPMYIEAQQANMHIQESLLTMRFARESLSAILSVEGYPWWFGKEGANLSPEQHQQLAVDMDERLQPGGVIFLFPLEVYRGDRRDNFGVLTFYRELKTRGYDITTYKITKDSLKAKMGPREKILATHSSLLTESPENTLSFLIAQKPQLAVA